MVPRLWARVRQLIASSENSFTRRMHQIVSKREACKKKGSYGKLALKGAKGGDLTQGASWGGLSTTLVELETMLGWANKVRSDIGEPCPSSPCSAPPEWVGLEGMRRLGVNSLPGVVQAPGPQESKRWCPADPVAESPTNSWRRTGKVGEPLKPWRKDEDLPALAPNNKNLGKLKEWTQGNILDH
jgi:hypothetical protein